MKWYNPFTWFPYTHEGRQTLVYMALAWAAPIICGMLIWAMQTLRDWTDAPVLQRLERFADIADRLSWGLLVILVSYACFVSIRAVKIGKDGFEASSFGDDDIVHSGDSVTVEKDEQ